MTRRRLLLSVIAVALCLICGIVLCCCSPKGGKKPDDGNKTEYEEVGGETVGNEEVGGETVEEPKISDTSFKGYEFLQPATENIPVTYSPLCMSTDYMNEAGVCGDGCQWPVSFECSTDGSLMLYGIDVAGMYRSVDHGVTWQKANTGITNRGVGMFGIDPKNSSHVLAVGLTGTSAQNTGMYISYDACETWRPTGFNVKIGGERYLWDGLEFDPTSYDSAKGICLDAYYSIPFERDRATRLNAYKLSSKEYNLAAGKQGLYKSSDGGESFTQISDDPRLADGIVEITDNGNILIGNQHGLFLVDGSGNIINSWLENIFSDYENDSVTITLDSGKTAEILKCYLGITGLDCVGNTVYAQTWDGIYTLDFGSSRDVEPQLITNGNYRSKNWPQFVAVSPSNPKHIVYQYRGRVDRVGWDTYWTNYIDVSFDGGSTWTTASADSKTIFTAGSWTARERTFIIDPTDDDNVLCLGPDTIMRSENGGLLFRQASGVSNMMCGGKMHFNYYDDELIMMAAQDYGGAVSVDGGKTFKRLIQNTEETSFGHCYDGFAADAYTYFGFARKSWTGKNELVITRDGGKQWTHTGIVFDYGIPGFTMQSYNDPSILFAGAYRSTDKGYTWSKMERCIAVCTISYGEGHELFGFDEERNILVSRDDGRSWSVAFDRETNKFNQNAKAISESIRDLSYDHINRIVYAAVTTTFLNSQGNEYSSQSFYKIRLDENLESVERRAIKHFDDPSGYENLTDIEVDPNAVNVIYVACAGNYFSNKYALQRSLDGGETWQVLTSNTDSEPEKHGLCTNRGGYEASMLAVSPSTGMVLVGCGCYGFEWITPPYERVERSTPPTHEVVFVCDGKVVHTEKVKNNRTFDYFYDEDGLTFEGWYTDKALTEPFAANTLIYNSLVLYAKMRQAEQVVFHVNGEIYYRFDLEYDKALKAPTPSAEGYVFGGWFADEELTAAVTLDGSVSGCDLYAGFYKIGKSFFDPSEEDFSAYLQFSNKRLSSVDRVPDGEPVDNRCAYAEIDPNKDYLLVMKMDVRCRYGLNKGEFAQNKAPDLYYIDEHDTNGTEPVDQWVYLTFNSEQYTRLLVFYYTAASKSGLSHEEIKATLGCYELLDDALVYTFD